MPSAGKGGGSKEVGEDNVNDSDGWTCKLQLE
jgi:hypothetical protein